jgi:biopolymer transport protein ExbD
MARKLRRKPEDNEVPLDMTPMIDCIFLLLIFFILTTKFTPDEKAIASLMPTDKGQAQSSSTSPVPKEQVNIKIYPRSPGETNQFVKGYQPSDYKAFLTPILNERLGRPIERIIVQAGGSQAVPVDGQALSEKGGPRLEAQLSAFRGAIMNKLQELDQSLPVSTRKDAPPVIIHCYSRLPWKFAILAYDAVRQYEGDMGAGVITKNQDLANAREVTFAPPRIRNYSANEDGNELYEIIHLQ